MGEVVVPLLLARGRRRARRARLARALEEGHSLHRRRSPRRLTGLPATKVALGGVVRRRDADAQRDERLVRRDAVTPRERVDAARPVAARATRETRHEQRGRSRDRLVRSFRLSQRLFQTSRPFQHPPPFLLRRRARARSRSARAQARRNVARAWRLRRRAPPPPGAAPTPRASWGRARTAPWQPPRRLCVLAARQRDVRLEVVERRHLVLLQPALARGVLQNLIRQPRGGLSDRRAGRARAPWTGSARKAPPA